MSMQDESRQAQDDIGPLGLLLVDGPNVMIKIKELWEISGEQRPHGFGIQYDPVAEFLRKKFGIRPENFQKTIFIKKVSDASSDEESVEKQDKFRFALERDGWDVRVRAQTEGSGYGEKENDIDDDLIDLASEFLEEALPNDLLIIMTNDFGLTPNGGSTKKVLENAARLGMKTAVVAFKPIAPELNRGKFEVIDSREIPHAYEVPPPLPRTIADVKPGTIEAFDRFAVKVVGRRPNKLQADQDKQETPGSRQSSVRTTGQSGSPQRIVPPPPGHSTPGNRSIPRPPTLATTAELRQSVMDVPSARGSTWVK